MNVPHAQSLLEIFRSARHSEPVGCCLAVGVVFATVSGYLPGAPANWIPAAMALALAVMIVAYDGPFDIDPFRAGGDGCLPRPQFSVGAFGCVVRCWRRDHSQVRDWDRKWFRCLHHGDHNDGSSRSDWGTTLVVGDRNDDNTHWTRIACAVAANVRWATGLASRHPANVSIDDWFAWYAGDDSCGSRGDCFDTDEHSKHDSCRYFVDHSAGCILCIPGSGTDVGNGGLCTDRSIDRVGGPISRDLSRCFETKKWSRNEAHCWSGGVNELPNRPGDKLLFDIPCKPVPICMAERETRDSL